MYFKALAKSVIMVHHKRSLLMSPTYCFLPEAIGLPSNELSDNEQWQTGSELLTGHRELSWAFLDVA